MSKELVRLKLEGNDLIIVVDGIDFLQIAEDGLNLLCNYEDLLRCHHYTFGWTLNSWCDREVSNEEIGYKDPNLKELTFMAEENIEGNCIEVYISFNGNNSPFTRSFITFKFLLSGEQSEMEVYFYCNDYFPYDRTRSQVIVKEVYSNTNFRNDDIEDLFNED